MQQLPLGQGQSQVPALKWHLGVTAAELPSSGAAAGGPTGTRRWQRQPRPWLLRAQQGQHQQGSAALAPRPSLPRDTPGTLLSLPRARAAAAGGSGTPARGSAGSQQCLGHARPRGAGVLPHPGATGSYGQRCQPAPGHPAERWDRPAAGS